ncbi:hypothetical protein ATEIFO6365_0004020200 [Aspergillus terreus]|uniref:TauD/TfdA-like domain-containing protein n=1 Tax=Aspergillus terreus TaxID=33178 RepID=A0A5M3YT67_ASPTE|nr:hypothetical protein ATETN484_0002022700 [Aspergillus terreus]GFF15083.1 hypothetical protein ATEIFO6365_0004020200 [Aspergillus terreus]
MGDWVEKISCVPDRAKYEAQQAIFKDKAAEASLPERFPAQLSSEMVWDSDSVSLDERCFVNDERCVLHLSKEQLDEIHDALQTFKSLNKPLGSLDPTTFPLPSLHPILRDISNNIHRGTGFSLVRGIPVDQYSREDNVIIYVGLSSHIGCIRGRQDHQHNSVPADVMIAHITDFSSSADSRSVTLPAYTDGEVILHTDTGDIVSLFALEEPAHGGESLLASGWRVYNELAKTRPDLVEALASDWPIPSSKKEGLIRRRPLIFPLNPSATAPDGVLIHFSRRSFSDFGGWSHSNALSVKQAEALDALHFLAESFHVAMELRKGDMQFLNNLSILHARRSYTDIPGQR